MTLTMDPDVQTALVPLLEAIGAVEPPPAGDWQTRRANVDHLLDMLGALRKPVEDVDTTDYTTTTADGAQLTLRWYTKSSAPAPGSAALYLHGGGMILGSLETADPTVREYVSVSGVPLLAVDYRLAPEHPHPGPVEDCYAGLVWLAANAESLGVSPSRIAVMGDSAGGGLAAGVALLARDRGGPPIAQQLLVYPMLDDRTRALDPLLAPFLTWTYDDNVTGWDALLGGAAADQYAAPARAESLAGLPPAYVEVGELDIFRAEDVAYAARLSAAEVPTELHVHPGAPHAFELFAPEARVARRAIADRVRRLASL